MRFLETHLVEELKKDTYTSLEALNAAVKKIVADIDQRPFQKKSDIRKSRMNGFEKYDKPRMNSFQAKVIHFVIINTFLKFQIITTLSMMPTTILYCIPIKGSLQFLRLQ